MTHFTRQEFSQALVSARSKVVLSHLTFSVKKKTAQSRRSQGREGLSSAMILIPMSELNVIQVLWKSVSI